MHAPDAFSTLRGVEDAYGRLEELLASQRCIMLDGGTGTELGRTLPAAEREHDEALWGTWSLAHTPQLVRALHRRYVEIGCDVISTNTWGLNGDKDAHARAVAAAPLDWIPLARSGIRMAREAVELAGKTGEVAVAFSINGDVDSRARAELFELLPRAFGDERPDLILLETITLIRDGLTLAAVEALADTGIPVWTSFRRCREGVCGVFGQHWGGPEGDRFGRVAHRLEALGVRALLINCLPPDHVPGMLAWLRDFTDLPLGVYPNLGYYTAEGWSFDRTVGGREYAELAAAWRAEGAQIIGGCCGVRPEHVAAAAERVREVPPGDLSPGAVRDVQSQEKPAAPWRDDHGRCLYPIELPELRCDPGVFVPTQGSFLVWKHLFHRGLGRGRRCLDIGSGTGLLTIQLARNGAEHVHAIDIDRHAVDNTLSNAFRNDVDDRVTGEVVDLYPWVPPERYDLVAASLYQMPVDPYEQRSTHRPVDFWGRNLVDHLIALLPNLLVPGGTAYLMQLSILGQERTAALLAGAGFQSRVVDFAFFNFHSLFRARKSQIARVEELSDAYHLHFGDEDVMVAYLVEITHAEDSETEQS